MLGREAPPRRTDASCCARRYGPARTWNASLTTVHTHRFSATEIVGVRSARLNASCPGAASTGTSSHVACAPSAGPSVLCTPGGCRRRHSAQRVVPAPARGRQADKSARPAGAVENKASRSDEDGNVSVAARPSTFRQDGVPAHVLALGRATSVPSRYHTRVGYRHRNHDRTGSSATCAPAPVPPRALFVARGNKRRIPALRLRCGNDE